MAEEAGVPRGCLSDSAGTDEIKRLQEHLRAWRTVASCVVRLIPLLHEEMADVARVTERAAMELGGSLRVLASTGDPAHDQERAASLSQIVMALQFQDIASQKLNHVTKALDEWRGHLGELIDATQDEHVTDRLMDVEAMERNLLAMEARCSDVSALKIAAQEPPTDQAESTPASESVTLF